MDADSIAAMRKTREYINQQLKNANLPEDVLNSLSLPVLQEQGNINLPPTDITFEKKGGGKKKVDLDDEVEKERSPRSRKNMSFKEEKADKRKSMDNKGPDPKKSKLDKEKSEKSEKSDKNEKKDEKKDNPEKEKGSDKSEGEKDKPVVEKGDHSVSFTGVAEDPVAASPDVGDVNVISSLYSRLPQFEEYIVFGGDGNVNLHSTIYLEGIGDAARSQDFDSPVDFFGPANLALHPSHIRFSAARAIGKVEWSGLADYIRHNVVDIKQVAQAVTDMIHGSELMTRYLANNLIMSPYIYDASTFYAICWLLFFQRCKYARRDIVPIVGAFDPNCITTRNLVPENAHASDRATEILLDMAAGRLTFFIEDLVDNDIQLIYHVCSGLPRFGVPLGHAGVDVLGSWHSPVILGCIYGVPPAWVPPNPVALTADEISGAICRIAGKRDEGDICIAGFIKAAELCFPRLVNGSRIAGAAPVAYQQYAMTAALQIGRVVWPAPRETNWMFAKLRLSLRQFRFGPELQEFYAIQNQDSDTLERIGLLIGSLISTAASTVLNDVNITGRILNSWVARNPGYRGATALLNLMSDFHGVCFVPLFWKLICGTIKNLTEFSIAPFIWLDGIWSDAGNSLVAADARRDDSWWCSVSAQFVPYRLAPQVSVRLWKLFAPHWYMLKMPIKFNLSKEFNMVAVGPVGGWRSAKGDLKYRTQSATPTAYKYIAYGGVALQALRWWLDSGANLPIGYEAYPFQVLGGDPFPVAFDLPNPPQPIFIAAIRMNTAGTILSYDWSLMAVIAPYVGLRVGGALSGRIRAIPTIGEVSLISGGILTESTVAMTNFGAYANCATRAPLETAAPSGDMIAVFGEVSGEQALRRLFNIMVTDESGARIIRDRPRIRTHTVNLDYLRSLPSGTLGKVYTDFLDGYHYTPDARREVRYVDDPDLAYVMTRYREIHDLVHAMLRQPTDMLGEVVVKWIEATQTRLPMCITAAWFGPLRLRPKQRQRYIGTYLPYALRVSRDARLFMNYYFEENWEKPLVEVWKDLNIEPPPVENTLPPV